MIETKHAGKKGVLCLAVAAALTLGTTSAAFAAAGTGAQGSFDENKKASTTVEMEVNVDKIAASVPVSLKVVAKTNGGDMDLPTDGTYKIQNKAPMAIYVSNVKAELGNGIADGWAIKPGPFSVDSESSTSGKNEFAFSVNSMDLSTATGASGANTSGASWNVAAGTEGAPGELALPLSASTSRLNTDKNVSGTFMTITYTIAPGSNS